MVSEKNRQWIYLFALGLACIPLLIPLGINLWAKDSYQFFPFAWVIGGGLWALRTQQETTPDPKRTGYFLSFFGLGFSLLVLGIALWSPWLGGLATVLLMASWSLFKQGPAALTRSLPPLALLLITLPPPLQADQILLQNLKQLAVSLSSRFLDLAGVVHLRSGALLEIPGEALLVEEACSGINSFLSALAAALFILLIERRNLWHSIVLLTATTGIVLAVNILRICGGAYLKVRYGWDLLSGIAHNLSGLVIFILALLIVWSLDRLIAFFTTAAAPAVITKFNAAAAPGPIKPDGAAIPRLTVSAVARRLPSLIPVLLTLAGTAGVIRGAYRWSGSGNHQNNGVLSTPLPAKRIFQLPSVIDGWTQMTDVPAERKASVEGIYSTIWNFEKDQLQVSLAIDYPFQGYHDVSICYLRTGWTVDRTELLPVLGASQKPATRLSMAKSSFARSEVLFATFTDPGQWIDPQQQQERLRATQRLTSRLFGDAESTEGPPQYRVQAMWMGLSPLLAEDRARIAALFETARHLLATQLNAAAPP